MSVPRPACARSSAISPMIQTPDPAQWQPPVPSLAALPVDKTKTDPKPAYYKLQFGDEITGFSYYVRTLNVIIGRNCVSAMLVARTDDRRSSRRR